MSTVETAEYLYGTYTAEDNDGYIRTRLASFPITRKTAKRIYYVRRTDIDGKRHLGFVDRQALESSGTEGVWARRTGGWWEADNRLYLTPPPLTNEHRAERAA